MTDQRQRPPYQPGQPGLDSRWQEIWMLGEIHGETKALRRDMARIESTIDLDHQEAMTHIDGLTKRIIDLEHRPEPTAINLQAIKEWAQLIIAILLVLGGIAGMISVDMIKASSALPGLK